VKAKLGGGRGGGQGGGKGGGLGLTATRRDEPLVGLEQGVGVRGGDKLAFTQYCHYQYRMACIAMKGGRGDITYCAMVWAMRGGEDGAQAKRLFANTSIDLCTKAST